MNKVLTIKQLDELFPVVDDSELKKVNQIIKELKQEAKKEKIFFSL